MRVRHLWSGLSVACAAALIAVTGAPLLGQSAPRTPWGDPDLQGTYTNTYENGTPLERPDEFAGRTLDQVKGEELANIRRSIQKRTIGAFLGPEHAPDNWWQDNLYLDRGSQAWLVIDPPDGKIPPLTADAQKKAQARAAARKASTRGPADSYRRSQSLRPLHHARPAGFDDAGDLRKPVSDRPGARLRGDPLRDDSRDPRDSSRRARRRSGRASRRTWAMRADVGKATRSS